MTELMPDNWLLYSSISIDLYAFGAHIPFWVYFLLSQSTRCVTPLLSSLICKKKKKIVTTIPSLLCTHSTDLCSICFLFRFVYQYYSEAQMSVVHPAQLTPETPLWRSAGHDASSWSLDGGKGEEDVQCSFCVLCCYSMQVVTLICTVYCNKKKEEEEDVSVRQREKCISPDALTLSSVSVDFVQTVHGRKKQKQNCCTVTESSPSSRQKQLWETPLDPAFCFSRFIFGASI